MYETGNKLTLTPFIRGIVGIWNFDGNGNDLSGQGNNFIASGSPLPSFAPGVLGQSYSFINGSTSTVLSATSSTSTTPLGASPRSMGIWVYPTSLPPSGLFYLFMIYGNFSADQAFGLIDNCQTNGSGPCGSLYLAVYGSNDLPSNTVIPLNQWSFIVGVYDGSNLYLYYNGNLIASKNIALTTTASIPLEIGNSPEVDSAFGVSAEMNGRLDEPFILNYALTPAQVQYIYYAERPH